jgi:ribosomal protein S1
VVQVPGTRVLPGMNVDLWSVVVCTQQGVVPVQKIKQMDWKGIASIHMYFSKSQEVTVQVQKLKIYVCVH